MKKRLRKSGQKTVSGNQMPVITIILVWLVSAVLLYFFFPVNVTVFGFPNDGNLHPADPVTAQTPLEQCVDGNFTNVTAIDMLLGTYQRINTNKLHFEVFNIVDGKKAVQFQTDFAANNLKDNDFFSIRLPGMDFPEKLCFLLTSGDGTNNNGITYWMNGQSQPVLKVRSTVTVQKAVENVSSASRFHLPFAMTVALCLLYLAANTAMILLVLFMYAQNSGPLQSPRSGRTRQKRI